MTKNSEILEPSGLLCFSLLAGITLAGLGLRYHHLAGNLYSDEVWINATAVSPFADFVREFKRDWVHPPLYHFLARAWVQLFGLKDVSGRLLSVTFGVLSIPLIYLLGKQISGTKVGLVSAALMALSPTHIYHSQYGRHYSLFVFFVLLSMIAFMKIYRSPEGRKEGIFYGLSTLLLVYTHYFGWLIVLCQALFFVFRRPDHLRRWVALHVLILLVYVPWVVVAVKASAATDYSQMLVPGSNRLLVPHIAWIEPPSLMEPLNTLALFNGHLPVSHQRKIGLLLLGGISLLSMKGIFRRGANHRDAVLCLFWYLVVPFVVVFVLSHTVQPIWILRAMLLSLPPYYLLISLGGRQVASTKVSLALMTIPILWMGLASAHYIRNEHRMPFETIAGFLERESVNGEPILVENTYIMNPLYHYYKGKGALYELRESNVSIVPAAQKGIPASVLGKIGKRAGRVILVTYTSDEEEIRAELSRAYRLMKRTDFFGYGEEGQMRNVRVFFYEKT